MESRDIDSSSNWLRSFADLMILLLVFFVIQVSPQSIRSKEESKQQKKLKNTIKNVKDYLKKENIHKDVKIETKGNQAFISLPDQLLFVSGSAHLNYEQKKILFGIIKNLKNLIGSHHIDIEGHTDSVPISTREHPSNWYLSSARSLEVLQVFIDLGFNQFHLSAQGFGEFRPLVLDRDFTGRDLPLARKKNRRVRIEITGLKNLERTFK